MFLQGAFEATVCFCRSGKAVMSRTIVDELGNHNDVLLYGVSSFLSFACALCMCWWGFCKNEREATGGVVDAQLMISLLA
jgi:hypothetical protein